MTLSSSKGPLSPPNHRENGKTTQPSEEQGGARDGMPKEQAWLVVGEEPRGAIGVGPKGGEEQGTDEVEKFSQVPRGLASVGC